MSDFFSKEKEKWLDERKKSLKGYYKGKGMTKSKHADIYYREALNKELDRFIKRLTKDLKENYAVVGEATNPVISVLSLYKNSKYRILIRNAEKIVNKWLKIASKSAESSVLKGLEETAGQPIAIEYDKAYSDALKLMVQRNVQLIKNTTTQTLTNIENIVYDSMTTGQGWYQLERDLNKQTHISQDRIKRIARDQTAKTNQALNELTQREAGVKYFMWETVKDERVSTGFGGHKQLQGKIYKWDDVENYPIIDSYGHRGLPSQRVNCRCDASPVFILKGYHAEKLNDGSYKVVKD